jgi:adenine-specific DNA-methyltransferase
MVDYKCEKCGKEFQERSRYVAHGRRKRSCIDECAVIAPPISHKKELGQYFTVSTELQQWVFDHVKHRGCRVLEPSFGAGHLLRPFLTSDPHYPVHGYELDATIPHVITFGEAQNIYYGDFLAQSIDCKYKTIVGNPPYVKHSNSSVESKTPSITGNLYLKFIERCFHLLDNDGGELLFIVPSDFLKLTSASKLIEEMAQNGDFTDFWFPHKENLFEGASIDVVVFRYERHLGKMDDFSLKKTVVNGHPQFIQIRQGIVTFSENEVVGTPLSELFHVYVGIVSGKDEVYRAPFGNLGVLTDKDRVESFVFAETFPTPNETINQHLLSKKTELMERRIRHFSENNWYEWGAPRNIGAIKAHLGEQCIYVRNMTRKKDVAFLDKMQYFGGALLCLYPKKKLDEAEMVRIVGFLNGPEFQQNYIYANRFKIGQKQLSNVIVPCSIVPCAV